MKLSSLALWMAALLLFSGCVSEEVPTKMAMGFPGKKSYPPVSTKGLTLKLISGTVLFTGKEAELNFALSNDSGAKVDIPEWYSCEENNLRLFIQVRSTTMNAPDPAAWVELPQKTDPLALHYPLVLLPGNKVIVSKKLAFFAKMQISAGHERRFYLQGKSALKSLEMSTPVVELRVLPAVLGNQGPERKK